jgi:hypothetical protein
MKPTRILITGDLSRTTADMAPNQLANARWVSDLIGKLLRDLTGLPVHVWFWDHGQGRLEAGKAFAAAIYECFGEEPSEAAWARIFWRNGLPAVPLVRAAFDNTLVLVVEMPPWLEGALTAADVPWIDLGVSPLRFLEDLLISFRLSGAFNAGAIQAFTVTDAEVRNAAERVRAFHAGSGSVEGLLFVAQTLHDRTQIRANGTHYGLEDVVAEVDRRLSGGPFSIKPHPLAPDADVVRVLAERGGRVRPENTYALLSAGGDLEVLTVSSSVARESPFFDVRATHVLNPEVLTRDATAAPTLHRHSSAMFWTHLLDGVCDIRRRRVEEQRVPPNFLRRRLGAWYAMTPEVWDGSA